ncbi:hypothetical protein [Archangium lipolyticum]|uniref:hypothetical protein n=1 Tax=Archangium lipolyticum TaxID=2970465 RepID=UPI002149F902|nr:hypothetical protein [Archangium lipolyticum]
MQIPGHVVLILWLLGGGVPSLPALPILAGAIAPDVPIVILYLRERYLQGLPEERSWRERYQRPFWLNLIHGAHSLPLSLAGALGGLVLGSAAVTAFFASVFLHALADLPVHAEDAHRHSLPFSHYRFISPISYFSTCTSRFVARRSHVAAPLVTTGPGEQLRRGSRGLAPPLREMSPGVMVGMMCRAFG